MTNGHPPRPEAKATAKDRLLQTIAILGLIAVLLLGAWGIIQLAFNLPNVFSNLGGSLSGIFNRETATSTREVIMVTVPQTVRADEPFSVTWRHTGSSQTSSYSISYACVDGLSMKISQTNGTYKEFACNTPQATAAKDKTTLIASYTGSENVRPTLTVSAVRSGRLAVSGTAAANLEAVVAEKPATTPAKKTTKTTTSTYYAAPKTTYYGSPDLAVTINSVNSLSSVYGRSVVTFTISNVGTNVAYSGWTFNAFLPVQGGYNYQGPLQQTLNPGDYIVYNLTFDNGSYGYGYDYGYGSQQITITADPYNRVYELNEFNNTASVY